MHFKAQRENCRMQLEFWAKKMLTNAALPQVYQHFYGL